VQIRGAWHCREPQLCQLGRDDTDLGEQLIAIGALEHLVGEIVGGNCPTHIGSTVNLRCLEILCQSPVWVYAGRTEAIAGCIPRRGSRFSSFMDGSGRHYNCWRRSSRRNRWPTITYEDESKADIPKQFSKPVPQVT
jgi:hypothetical protein